MGILFVSSVIYNKTKSVCLCVFISLTVHHLLKILEDNIQDKIILSNNP